MLGEQDRPFLGLEPRRYGLPAPLCDDIALIDRVLGAVIAEQNGASVLDLARRLYEDDLGEPDSLFARLPELADAPVVLQVLRAYAILFQLLNTAEQKEIVRANRERQAKARAGLRPESIGEAITTLAAAGVTSTEMQALLDRLDICPTLTAHPTEARRRSVQDKLQAIAEALVDRALPTDIPRLDGPLNVVDTAETEMKRAITALWQTDEVRATPLT